MKRGSLERPILAYLVQLGLQDQQLQVFEEKLHRLRERVANWILQREVYSTSVIESLSEHSSEAKGGRLSTTDLALYRLQALVYLVDDGLEEKGQSPSHSALCVEAGTVVTHRVNARLLL
ncbi:hypothetical protein [Pajaroellobacter abortibovis]|uniref:Uncharacterized protein n=1 Tax=Pajaroellobacter abortibovis TaxID=1882918 RepID=A0A1L6MWK4_9BACT|nr:hypothetical protein [Pajaroellobacter abortibovis]APR99798.1 hypothetical protein BCY86_03235 [Pajaroellobacter abortibovis]